MNLTNFLRAATIKNVSTSAESFSPKFLKVWADDLFLLCALVAESLLRISLVSSYLHSPLHCSKSIQQQHGTSSKMCFLTSALKWISCLVPQRDNYLLPLRAEATWSVQNTDAAKVLWRYLIPKTVTFVSLGAVSFHLEERGAITSSLVWLMRYIFWSRSLNLIPGIMKQSSPFFIGNPQTCY